MSPQRSRQRQSSQVLGGVPSALTASALGGVMIDPLSYDVFISYSRKDNERGWVTGLYEAILQDFRGQFAPPIRIFFDKSDIKSRQDWKLRLLQGLRTSRVLLVCLSPNYLRSEYCKWEWDEFAQFQARRVGGGDAITGAYFAELGGDDQYHDQIAAWRREVTQVQLVELQEWFPHGAAALREAKVRELVKKLGLGVHEQVSQARLAKAAPGNLRRHNPGFVGRTTELNELHLRLTGGALGVVTALHGIGGMGKTELAVTYAHAFAHMYQGGIWQVDADGQTNMLEAIAPLASARELGLQASDASDARQVGRLVLARLVELTHEARRHDEATGACFLLLDNVSEPQMLTQSQLDVLPPQPWFHVAVTTRLDVSDIGAAGSRASAAVVAVGRLDAEDALELIREHQPARDSAGLHSDFNNPDQAEAARKIVEMLDGYTLAIEQAGVYLGNSGVEPTELLATLQAQGTPAPDIAAGSSERPHAIQLPEKLAGVITDHTIDQLPRPARSVLAFASLLPPDTIPWDWLEQLTESATVSPPTGVPRLTSRDDWRATKRILEGRRLLAPADDPRFARLHRVLGEQLRSKLVNPETELCLDNHLQQVSQQLGNAGPLDTALLAVTATALTARLAAGRHELAQAALDAFEQVQRQLSLTVADSLASATVNACQQLTRDGTADTKHWRWLAASLHQAANVRDTHGDAEGALRFCNQAVEISHLLAAENPRSGVLRRNLAVSVQRMAELLADQGDVQGALDRYGHSLRLIEELVAVNPDEELYRRDLISALRKMGDARAAHGDPQGGIDCYSRSLGIVEQLADANSTEIEHQSSLAACLRDLGDMEGTHGTAQRALDHYARALGIVERLVAADPNNKFYQRQLATTLDKVGSVRAAHGDARGSLDYYTRAAQITDRLTSADPTSIPDQHNLALQLGRVADMRAALGDMEGALDHYLGSQGVFERVIAADPTNLGHQRELSVTLERVATTQSRLGDAVAALENCGRVVQIREEIAGRDPEHTGYQHDVALSLATMASMLRDCGDRDAATSYYARALRIAERLAAADPQHSGFQRAVAAILRDTADIHLARGDEQAALDDCTAGLRIFHRLAAADPSNGGHQRDLVACLGTAASIRVARGELREAMLHYRECVSIYDRLAIDPNNTGDQRNLAIFSVNVASMLDALGEPGSADYLRRANRILLALDAAGKLHHRDRNMFADVERRLAGT